MSFRPYRVALVAFAVVCTAGLPSCAHEQQLESITVDPGNETFGAPNIPVSADAGLSVQLRALGNYIHPPVTKDITDKVIWTSSDPQMVTVNSTGLIVATGDVCGTGTLIFATVNTNSSTGGRNSSGAIVTGKMTANVVCFTGTSGGPLLTVSVSGTGSVTSNPAGISSCVSICSANFASGAAITLTATPTGSATSVTWSGCDTVSGLVCTINNLTANTLVTASFS